MVVLKSLVVVALLLIHAGMVLAEHEPDHRYTVRGYVRDAAGKPKKDVPVLAEHNGGTKESIKTDGSGYYEIRFHLHDSNKGDEITVTADGATKKIAADFDPNDKTTWRIGNVDFGAPAAPAGWGWVAFVGGGAVAAGGGYYFRRRQKQVRREEKKEERQSAKKKRR